MPFILLAALLLASCQSFQAEAQPQPREILQTPAAAPTAAGPHVVFGARSIPVEVADTAESRRQGLSGREALPEDTGMALVWSEPTPTGIWMPDMNFPLDVIFVVHDRVVAVYKDAQPCPDTAHCPVFGPQTPVDFVLEVPAGSAARWGLKVGDSMMLKR